MTVIRISEETKKELMDWMRKNRPSDYSYMKSHNTPHYAIKLLLEEVTKKDHKK